jgi:hypothetical protein
VLRLHAVDRDDAGVLGAIASCGYRYSAGELRPDRPWETVTRSGRCTLCDVRPRSGASTSIDMRDARHVDASRQPSER